MLKTRELPQHTEHLVGPGSVVGCLINHSTELVEVSIIAMVRRKLGEHFALPLYICEQTGIQTVVVAALSPHAPALAELISLALVPYRVNKEERRAIYRGPGILYGSKQDAIEAAMSQVSSQFALQD